MSSEHEDAAAVRISRDAATFASLPLPLACRVFLALPPDARGRACCVCRAWRDALAAPALWTRLDLSTMRVRCWQRFLTVLFGAATRAQGQLCVLDLSQQQVSREVLLLVLTAGSLRELHLHNLDAGHGENLMSPTVEQVAAAAPLLQVLTAEDVGCMWEGASRVLRAEPPFALLQTRHTLRVQFCAEDVLRGGMDRVGPFAAALADAALQPALLKLCVEFADTAQPDVMGALVDAVLARRLRKLKLSYCTSPPAAPLARLLTGSSLTSLSLCEVEGRYTRPLFDAAGATLVADALRTNTTLTKLDLFGTGLCRDMDAAGALLGALVGHSSLRELKIVGEHSADSHTFGVALAALIAADAPALLALDCSENSHRDAGLAPIVEALPLNHHLRELDVRGNGMSATFARERLLPAVRANTTLRALLCANDMLRGPVAAEAEAEELVRRRWQHD